MKKIILFLIALVSVNLSFSQNTFPLNGNVGIGTNFPSVKLEIVGNNSNDHVLSMENNKYTRLAIYSGSNTWYEMPLLAGYRCRGSVSNPTDVLPNDRIFGDYGSMYVNGAYRTTAAVEMMAGSIIDNTHYSSYIIFGTTSETSRQERMRITEYGNVGISTTNPSYKFHVNGNAGKPGSNLWIIASDRRLKQDITPFTDGLEVLQKINPVWYRYNGKAGTPTDEKYVGIIAQDMQKVAPYTIGTFDYKDERGELAEYLDYDGNAVTYITINAIKEQQQLIEALQERIEALENLIAATGTSLLTSGGNQTQNTNPYGFVLYQNVPNPFDKTTTITAVVPEQVQDAKIIIYNLQGLELENYPITRHGNTSVKISAGRFPSGMYLYALLADGQVIDTKKMILTK